MAKKLIRTYASLQAAAENAAKKGDEASLNIFQKAAQKIKELGMSSPKTQLLLPFTPDATKAKVFREELVDPLSTERKVFKEASDKLCGILGNNPSSNMRDAIEEFCIMTGSASPREMLNMMFRNGEQNKLKKLKHYLDFIANMAQGSTPVMPIAMIEKNYIPYFMGADITEFAMRMNEENTISANSGRLRSYFDEMSTIEAAKKDIIRNINLGILPQADDDVILKLSMAIVPSERIKLIEKYERDGYVQF